MGWGYPIDYLSFASTAGTDSGVTESRKSSLIITGVLKPHAPRHSTSITVNFPSADVWPSSWQPVCLRNASTTCSAPHDMHGYVVQTWMKCLPTGCWWYMV